MGLVSFPIYPGRRRDPSRAVSSPEAMYRVVLPPRIGGEQAEAATKGCRHEEAVERIGMQLRKLAGAVDIIRRDLQQFDLPGGDLLANSLSGGL